MTKSLSISTLQVSATRLKQQAFNKQALSEAFLHKQAIALHRDERLTNFPFGNYKSIQQLIMHVCHEGSALEKMALCDVFDFKVMLSLPRIDALEKQGEIVATLKSQLLELAGYFGSSVQGDMGTLAWIMVKKYGDLTIFDFIKFFAMCKNREFTGDFEFVKTQGINPDFILKWLDLYCDRRDSEIEALKDELRREDAPTYAPEVLELQKNILTEFVQLETEAKRLRREYSEKVLNESYNDVFQDDMGNAIPYKTTRPTEKAHVIRLFNFMRDFVYFDDAEKATDAVKQIGEQLSNDYDNVDAETKQYFNEENFTKEFYKRQQATLIVGKLERTAKSLNPVHVLEKAFTKAHKEYATTFDFITFLGLTMKPAEGMTQEEIANTYTLSMIAKKIVKHFEKEFMSYLRNCIAEKVVPLESDLYLLHRVLHFLYTKQLDRPFQDLTNYQ